jgi:hypothetical protein
LYLAAHLQAAGAVRVALMLVGSVIIYDYCHAVFHWAVGRLLGIRFRSYGARGTDHSETYPLGIRQFMSVMPFFTAMTQRESMREASPTAKALMFAAGETGTTVVSLVAAFYAWQSGIPGGGLLFWVMVGWTVAATIATPPRRRGTMLRRSRYRGPVKHPSRRPPEPRLGPGVLPALIRPSTWRNLLEGLKHVATASPSAESWLHIRTPLRWRTTLS